VSHSGLLKPFVRVFALAPDCHTSGRYQRVWQRHFYDGLQAALPSVVVPEAVDFEWARPVSALTPGPSPDRSAVTERLWDQIGASHAARGLDAVISYCFSTDIDPALIERTVHLGVPWINFYCDSTYAFDYVEALARVTSLNWYPEHSADARYRALGRPRLCRPYAVHPGALPEAGCETAEHALGFVGTPNGSRIRHLAGLLLFGRRAAVRGEGWRRQRAAPAAPRPQRPPSPDFRTRGRLGERILVRALMPLVRDGARPLADDEIVPFLSRCRVVLGLNEGRDLNGVYQSYMKLRDVEFPGHGCCYLTQHNADVEHAFDVGRELLTFRHVAEAASLVRRSVRHPEDARAIGRAARRRVLAEHTWAARLVELARAL
jgi:glycosyl transferase family 1